mmetsp:Transcript_40344/g.79579  ORF Transcript_40344/g.79579 Transcript_40344/m.79579 type:complete len:103 (+) Transcript_40344:224-532(+)
MVPQCPSLTDMHACTQDTHGSWHGAFLPSTRSVQYLHRPFRFLSFVSASFVPACMLELSYQRILERILKQWNFLSPVRRFSGAFLLLVVMHFVVLLLTLLHK